MTIAAIRITITVRIDKMETYSKNAPALPSNSAPQKTKIGDRI
jgi:hypothetical protein